LKVTLYNYQGKNTHHHIGIEIDSAGNIVISGISLGEIPSQFSDNSLSEFSVLVASRFREKISVLLQTEFQKTIPKESFNFDNQDREILWLLGRLYGGRISGYLEFCELLQANGIPFKHKNYI
jgi:hypothetical protein